MWGCADNQIGTAGVESILGALSSGKCAVTTLLLSGARLAPLCLPTRPLPAARLPRLGAAAAAHRCGVGVCLSLQGMRMLETLCNFPFHEYSTEYC